MKTARYLLALLAVSIVPVAALESDRAQPIEVEADRLEMREQENISIYEGNVRLVQGSLKIQSDRMVIHFNDANELTLMQMTGNPARFRQLDDSGQEMIGIGREIDYIESSALLELRRDASFEQAGDVIRSELIRINTETSAIEAGGTESDNRVKMVIKPRAGESQQDGGGPAVDE